MKEIVNFLRGLSILFIAALSFTACSSSDEPNTDDEKEPMEFDSETTAVSSKLKEFYVDYTIDALEAGRGASSSEVGNILVAPYSTAISLGVFANSIDANDATWIKNYLGVEDMDAFGKYVKTCNYNIRLYTNQYAFDPIPLIWYEKKETLNGENEKILKEYYKASFIPIDFSDTKMVAETINEFASPYFYSQVIPSLQEGTKLVLMSDFTFGTPWTYSDFDKSNLSKGTFKGIKKEAEVDMITLPGNFQRKQVGDFVACDLKTVGDAFTLTLILPSANEGADVAIPSLSSKELKALLDAPEGGSYKVRFPKCGVKTVAPTKYILPGVNMEEKLKDVDITLFRSPFKGNVDLNQSLYFGLGEEIWGASNLNQAASTKSVEVKDLVFDRPFYFYLRENSTGLCVFSGLITDIGN